MHVCICCTNTHTCTPHGCDQGARHTYQSMHTLQSYLHYSHVGNHFLSSHPSFLHNSSCFTFKSPRASIYTMKTGVVYVGLQTMHDYEGCYDNHINTQISLLTSALSWRSLSLLAINKPRHQNTFRQMASRCNITHSSTPQSHLEGKIRI